MFQSRRCKGGFRSTQQLYVGSKRLWIDAKTNSTCRYPSRKDKVRRQLKPSATASVVVTLAKVEKRTAGHVRDRV
eukprot:6485178-Amphidinium_carterae.1